MNTVRRMACHEVAMRNGQCFSPGVVEIDEEGTVVKAYLLDREIADTVWIGGKIEIVVDGNGNQRACKEKKYIT